MARFNRSYFERRMNEYLREAQRKLNNDYRYFFENEIQKISGWNREEKLEFIKNGKAKLNRSKVTDNTCTYEWFTYPKKVLTSKEKQEIADIKRKQAKSEELQKAYQDTMDAVMLGGDAASALAQFAELCGGV